MKRRMAFSSHNKNLHFLLLAATSCGRIQRSCASLSLSALQDKEAETEEEHPLAVR